MTLSAAVEAPDGRVFSRQPQLWLVAAIAAAGCAAPARSVALALRSNDVDLVQAGQLDWITVPYILSGLIAWWRRPVSRLGLLMIAGGVASGLSALQLTHVDVLSTIGAASDILPAALTPHGSRDLPVRGRPRLGRGALRGRELPGPVVPAAAADDAGRDRAIADRLPARPPRRAPRSVGRRRARHRAAGRSGGA